MSLRALGWDDARDLELSALPTAGLEPGRVVTEDKHHFGLRPASGEFVLARVPGRFLRSVVRATDLPKVGDWVLLKRVPNEAKAIIERVLTRRTWLSRKEPGREVEEQLLVTNVDVACVVQPLDAAFNPRLLQRQLAMVREGGAQPVAVLNKADLCADMAPRLAEAAAVAGATPLLVVSARTRRGLPQLRDWLKPACTVVFLGASGVGKSSLINRLHGEEVQATTDVRESDSKGRHTTTWRELIVLPGGALVIDTPGMREVHLWTADDAVQSGFPEIEVLAARCHFRDCSHTQEKRCAVQEALASGQLERARYEQFLKLQRERVLLGRARAQRGFAGRNRSMRVAQRGFNKPRRVP